MRSSTKTRRFSILLASCSQYHINPENARLPSAAWTPSDGSLFTPRLAHRGSASVAGTRSELRIPGAAAQTRVVSMAGIRLGSGNPRELSKG
jgi:hypothetical protein